MKKLLSLLLVLCLCGTLAACGPSENELLEQAALLIMQDAQEQLENVSYCRVAIDSMESVGKNAWTVTGNVNYTNDAGITTAVLYSSTLRYNAEKKTYSTDTIFGKQFQL